MHIRQSGRGKHRNVSEMEKCKWGEHGAGSQRMGSLPAVLWLGTQLRPWDHLQLPSPTPPPPTPCNWPSSCMCVHHLLAKGSVPGNWTHMSALPLGPWLTVFYLACLDCHAPGPDPWQISFFPFGRCPLSLPLHRDSTPTVNPRVSSSERYGPSLEKHLLEVTGKF